jgi:iron complex transport system substrate-binding protein
MPLIYNIPVGVDRAVCPLFQQPLRRLSLLLILSALAWGQANVVSLSAPLTETVYLLGASARLAAVSDTSVFPEKAAEDQRSGKIRALPFSKPDLAVIDAMHPALILTSTTFQRQLAAELRERGYTVLHFEPASIEEVFRQTERIGEALGRSREALEITASLRRELSEIQTKSSKLPRVRVYMEINHEGPWTTGAASPENEMIRIAGGENVFSDRNAGAFVTSNAEVVRRDPQVILSPIWLNAKVGGIDGITTLAEILARPGYSGTAAVVNSRVLYYDSALLKHQGPREILAIRKLAYLLHPEVFENPPGTIPWELGRVRQ